MEARKKCYEMSFNNPKKLPILTLRIQFDLYENKNSQIKKPTQVKLEWEKNAMKKKKSIIRL